MVEPHESFFWQMALRSGLVDADRLRECWDAIPPDRRAAETIDRRLARGVVEAGCLTAWQAQQVARGRGASIQINKYVLLDVIGQGGMGRVFLARDTRLNRRVALKVLSQDRLKDPRAILRFRREARLGAQLQHENLVRIYDEGEVNGHCYLVMEYIEGPSVGALLAEHGPMPTSTASRLGRQVALGLEHARQKGMIHRDVNPHNILVTRDGTAKLTDLGLAIELGDDNGVTLDGGLIGNYDYISPEQARHSRDVDSRSDIYSLGCTLYHMVAGRVPFPSSSLPEKIHAQLTVEPPPLGSLMPGVPKGFGEVVARMMRKSPGDRPPDPLAVARALEPFIEGEAFANGVGATSALYSGPGRLGDAQARTQVSPIGPPTVDGGLDPSTSGLPALSRSASSSEINPPAPTLPPTEPAGLTSTSTSQEIGPGSVAPVGHSAAHPSSAFLDRASGPRDFRSRWPRIALASLVAATTLAALILAAKPWRRGSDDVSIPEVGAGPTPGSPPEAKGESLTVAVVKADGTEVPARDLKDALRQGERGDLRIILRGRGREPVRLEAEGLEVLSGSVTIGADPGSRPTLVVALSGAEPFLRVRTRASLKLEGLTIRAEYAGQGEKMPPLIDVKGTLELSRCAFWTTDQAVAGGAVSTEGPRLSATGCWFGGFKQCLDVAAFAGTEVELTQCMLIRSPGSDPWDSWVIRVRHEPAHAAVYSRKLTLRRCTIRGACLLRADDFHRAAPLGVSIVGTAVQADVLLAWKSGPESAQGCLIWSGWDNWYDLSRASKAIRLDGPAAVPGGLNDADVWTRLMDERRSQDRPISFPDPSAIDRGPPRPGDFPAQELDGAPIGADPAQVGPESTAPAPGVGLGEALPGAQVFPIGQP